MACAASASMSTPSALSGPLAGAAFVGGVAAGLALAEDPYPRPGAEPAAIRRYFTASRRAARISVAGQLVSAAALARFGATVARVGEGRSPPWLRTTTTAAGATAAASLAVSALTSLALTRDPARSDAELVALHRRLFIAGGPVHTAAFGALVGCVGLAGRHTGRLPPALTTAALASAAAGGLSPLGLLAEPAMWLIPAGRFSGLVVCGVAGVRLSR